MVGRNAGSLLRRTPFRAYPDGVLLSRARQEWRQSTSAGMRTTVDGQAACASAQRLVDAFDRPVRASVLSRQPAQNDVNRNGGIVARICMDGVCAVAASV